MELKMEIICKNCGHHHYMGECWQCNCKKPEEIKKKKMFGWFRKKI